MGTNQPSNVTVYGRLSWPVFSHAEAVSRNARSDYPLPAEQVTPTFNLLLEQPQLNKFINHVTDVFLPWVQSGEAKTTLDERQVDMLLKQLASDWEMQPPYIPLKPVPEKTIEMAPEAVAMLKVNGRRGIDIDQKAIVNDESELLAPTGEPMSFPVAKPIRQTVHSLYGGCYAAATLNLYAYLSGKMPGFSASAGVVVFKADGNRFGGGVDVDEDEIFLD